MSRYVFKLPDLGEGTVEAELTQWNVKPGDWAEEDQAIAEVMTEKAAVEISAPVTGRVVSISGEPGDMISVGAELIVFETSSESVPRATIPARDDSEASAPRPQETPATKPHEQAEGPSRQDAEPRPVNSQEPSVARRVMTSPAIRHRAKELGIDLELVPGSGRGGRIVRKDLDAYLARPANAGPAPAPSTKASSEQPEEIKIVGLRRVIARRMAEAKRTIPHFSYVDEVDVTALESLRNTVNGQRDAQTPSLSYLPFIVLGLVRTLQRFPQCNVVHDAERELLLSYKQVHVGIATQTPRGLTVPVVHDAHKMDLWTLATEIGRVTTAARDGSASKQMLSGSTITVTSLGRIGGIASTPVINAPEVAIIGVNKAVDRPMVVDGSVAIRRMMNLSSSFDHRFVDGYDAAAMIQALRELLEQPALLFMPNQNRMV